MNYSFQSFIIFFIFFSLSFNYSYSQDDSSLFKEADEAFEAGDFNKAIQLFSDISEHLENENKQLTDNYFYASTHLMDLYSLLGDYSTAFSLAKTIEDNVSIHGNGFIKVFFESTFGRILYAASDLDESLIHLNKADSIAEKESDWENQIKIKQTIGGVLATKEEFETSFQYLKSSLKLALKHLGPNDFRVAASYAIIAQTYQYQNKPKESLSFNKKFSLLNLNRIDPNHLKGNVYDRYDSLSRFYTDFMDLDKTDGIFDQLLPQELRGYVNIAYQLIAIGELTLAKRMFVALTSSSTKRDIPVLIANGKMGLANIYQRTFQRNYAARLYEEALSILTEENTNKAWSYHNLAIVYGELGEFDKQLTYNNKALSIRKKAFGNRHNETAASYVNIGAALFNGQQYQASINAFNKALNSGYNDPDYLFYSKAKSFFEMGATDSATFYGKRSLESSNLNDPFYSFYSNFLGDLYLDNDDVDSALHYFRQALFSNYLDEEGTLPPLKQINIDQIRNLSLALESTAKIAGAFISSYKLKKDVSELLKANQVLELSRSLISEIRSSFIQEVDHLKLSKLTRDVSEKAIFVQSLLSQTTNNSQDYIKQALRFTDLNKSQILLDAIKTRGIIDSPVNQELARIGGLKDRIRKEKALLKDQSSNQGDEATGDLLGKLEGSLATALLDLKVFQPEISNYLTQKAGDFNIDELIEYANDEDQVVLEYFWGEEALYLIKLEAGTLSMFSLETDLHELQKRTMRIKKFLSTPEASDSTSYQHFLTDSHRLYQDIVAPGIKNLVDKSLLIIPDGPLANLPFEVLLTTDLKQDQMNFSKLPYLIKSSEINYASSIQLLLENKKRKSSSSTNSYMAWAPFSTKDNIRTIGSDVLRSEGLSKLPNASQELAALDQYFDGESLFGASANESSFKKKAQNVGIVHIASHSILNDKDPLLSNILFGAANPDLSEDNRLYMYEVYALSLNSELAVLTACNTGAGVQEQGEGIISLARAFKYAGVKSVLMSLWLANDESTATIMRDFYKNLSLEQTKSQALRQAKIDYLAQADNATAHPFYWSHLVVSGNNRPITADDSIYRTVIISLALVALALLLFRRKNRLQTAKQ